MDTLFALNEIESKSPRLLWMDRHGIITLRHAPGHSPPTWFAGFQAWWPDLSGVDFFANETAHNGDSRVGEGDTEEEALVSLMTCWDARKANLRLWHDDSSA